MKNKTPKAKYFTVAKVASILLAITLLVLLIPMPILASTTKEKLESAKSQLEQLESDLAKTKQEISDLEAEEKRLTDDLQWLEARTEEQSAVYAEALEQKSTAYTIMLEDNAAYKESLQELSDKQEQYSKRLRQMYKWHDVSLLEALLSSESLQCFFTTVRFMKIISDADEQALQDLEIASAKAETLRQRSEDSYNELTKLAEEADAVLQDIKANRAQTQSELNEASYSLSLIHNKKDQLGSEIDRTTSDVKSLQKQYEEENRPKPTKPPKLPANIGGGQAPNDPALPSIPASNQGYAWPVPSSSYISSYYGWRNIFGWVDWHQGLDIAAAMGSSAVAARSGTVVYAGWLGSYGNLIIVDHGDGISTRYGHLSGYNCSYGQHVNKGQVIGFIGSTGNSTGPHLHFEIRSNGYPVNPLSYY